VTIRNRAWVCLVAPPVVWFLFEQGLSALLHADCSRSGVGIGWGLASLAVIILIVRLGWSLRTSDGALANPWIARLGLAGAAIFALAVTFQTLAIALVPACLR
jgi:hypothetical protein